MQNRIPGRGPVPEPPQTVLPSSVASRRCPEGEGHYLLGLTSAAKLERSPFLGSLFEGFAVAEIVCLEGGDLHQVFALASGGGHGSLGPSCYGISCRLTTARLADQIHVMPIRCHGRVETHEKLVGMKRGYAEGHALAFCPVWTPWRAWQVR